MEKYEVKGNLQIDPYGHKKLSPRISELPEGAVFVAEAVVWVEAIGTRERYWLYEEHGSVISYSLWCEIDELAGEYRACSRLKPESATEPVAAARWLVSVLWYSRVSEVMAMSLDNFDVAGLLNQSWLDLFTKDFHQKLNPPDVPEGAETVSGEFFYESGELKYRGEHWREQAHGKGTAFWKNGNVWCEGAFRNHDPHGYCRMYFRNGKLRHEGEFVNGYPKGPGTEYYDNGQVWFEGVFASQTHHYGYGGRKYLRGRLFDKQGKLIHDGDFVSDGHRSKPVGKSKGGRS